MVSGGYGQCGRVVTSLVDMVNDAEQENATIPLPLMVDSCVNRNMETEHYQKGKWGNVTMFHVQ